MIGSDIDDLWTMGSICYICYKKWKNNYDLNFDVTTAFSATLLSGLNSAPFPALFHNGGALTNEDLE